MSLAGRLSRHKGGPPTRTVRPGQWALLGAGAASVALWAVPPLRFLLWPLTLFNTHVHELCHALAALATGGQVEHILVRPDGSGVTPVMGGNLLVLASAGYLGSAVVGGLMIAFARTEKSSRAVMATVGAMLGLSMLLFVRGELAGLAMGAFWTAAFLAGAKFLRKDAAVFVARFMGMQLGLTALQAVTVLLRLSTSSEAMSDAKILEQASLVPAVFWALGWAACAVVALWLGLRSAWRGAAREGK
ncbi:MAG: M50 family metallopeptidase [Fimbriimonadaceae bacterium]|nr:M50 family metallopeptidase [Fimbriimonadaceae bacterium]